MLGDSCVLGSIGVEAGAQSARPSSSRQQEMYCRGYERRAYQKARKKIERRDIAEVGLGRSC